MTGLKSGLIGFEAFFEGEAGRISFLGIAGPGIKCWILEGASKRESDRPGEGAILFNSREIIGGLFGGLAARKEDDASKFFRDVAFEDLSGGYTNFFGSRRGFELFAS